MDKLNILDCTIRDGGYVNNWNFTQEQVKNLYQSLSNSGVDYMEIGFRREKIKDELSKFGPWYFCDEELLNNTLNDIKGCKIAVMAQLGTFSINNFIPKKDSKIDMVRVLMAYHGFNKKTDEEIDLKLLDEGIEQMNQLRKLGYEVSFNIGRIDKINENQLDIICKKISKVDLKYFYMADTYGELDLHSSKKYIDLFNKLLHDKYKTNIKVGFHAHNNLQNATCKTLYASMLNIGSIDGTILGYGRGSGNACTELLVLDRIKNYKENYNFIPLFIFADKYLKNYKENIVDCSYNLIYVLTAYYGMHVNYAIEIIQKQDKMPIKEVITIYEKIIENKKNMFYYPNLITEYKNI